MRSTNMLDLRSKRRWLLNREFERADVKERKSPARRVLVGIGGTGIPMLARPVRAVASLIPPSAAARESPEPSAAVDPARKAARRRIVRIRQRLR